MSQIYAKKVCRLSTLLAPRVYQTGGRTGCHLNNTNVFERLQTTSRPWKYVVCRQQSPVPGRYNVVKLTVPDKSMESCGFEL
eukprot:9099021-Pyramimonas_sp.AAC.1